jgi:hypothetical protein
MTCPKCSREIPQGKLACVDCLEISSHAEALRCQLHPLRQMRAQRAMLVLRYIDNVRHAQMVSIERTFCYVPVETHYRRGATTLDNYLAYDERVCEKCQHQIAALMREAAQCSA